MRADDAEGREIVRIVLTEMMKRKLSQLQTEEEAQGRAWDRAAALDRFEETLAVMLPHAQAEMGWPQEHNELMAELAWDALTDLRRQAV